jgi:uncharacterized protein
MMINIRDLAQKGAPVALTGVFDLSGILTGREDIQIVGKLEAELTAHSQGGLAEVEGTIRFKVHSLCSRCLTPVDETLAVPFRERFASRPDAVPQEDQDEVHLVTDDHITLDPYVEEAVWLALPLAPLCSSGCKGLCPQCGTNLNEKPCGCSNDSIDPRLAGLADFFKQ